MSVGTLTKVVVIIITTTTTTKQTKKTALGMKREMVYLPYNCRSQSFTEKSGQELKPLVTPQPQLKAERQTGRQADIQTKATTACLLRIELSPTLLKRCCCPG